MLYTCGRILLTFHPTSLAVPPAELIYEPCQFQQIRHTEHRAMLADGDLRVRSNQIRPLRRNRANSRIVDPQQKTSSRKVVPLAHASELLAAEWMKRVRDTHKTRTYDRSVCILD